MHYIFDFFLMVNSDQNILIEVLLSFYDVSGSFEAPWLSKYVQFGFILFSAFAIKAFFSHSEI